MKKALITGISGQDGSYLAELLLSKGYEVHGILRHKSTFGTDRMAHIYEDPHHRDARLFLHYGDVLDPSRLSELLTRIRPDEIYNLAAQSHVRVSFAIPEYTGDVTALGCMRLLAAIQATGIHTRFYQASSSEMFGKVCETPQNEATPFYPRSPYAYAKLYSYWATVNAREATGLHASNGILFNHESPRRKETFVTRKITRGLAKILAGKDDTIYLGNLDAKRDWGYAKEYVEAMWLMLQQDTPDDYVIATGETHSVKEFLEEAFGLVGLDWKDFVKHDPRYNRPTEVDLLLGDASKARKKLKWEPKVKFKELVKLMVEHDLASEHLDLQSAKLRAALKSSRVAVAVGNGNARKTAKNETVFVAGHKGLVGSAVVETLRREGYSSIVVEDHRTLDLVRQESVEQFFRANRIDHVIVAAAKVGGILANAGAQADFLSENLLIAANLIRAAAENGVKRLVFLGSSCIYPKHASQPIREESLLTGPLEPSNEGYAIAKIAGIKLCEKYREQYQKDFVSVMPTNLYGPGDNFHPHGSHVIPGMMRKVHDAKASGLPSVALWGSGTARREFLHSSDLASAIVTVLERYEGQAPINVGSGEEVTIRELAEMMCRVVGFKGRVEFDATRPDGTPRKLLDSSRILALGWKPRTGLEEGLRQCYRWAIENGALAPLAPLKKIA